MPRKIAYIGYGALGTQLSLLVRQTWTGIDSEIYFDDLAAKEKISNAWPFALWEEARFADYEFFVCLGYKQLGAKASIIAALKKLNRQLATYIHPTAIINPETVISPGCIIYAGCNIDQHVRLQEGVFLNNSVTVSHESVIGANSFLAPGVVICGHVKTGRQCFIGAGSIIANGIIIGDEVIAGVGTVITKDVLSGSSVIGNPMRVLDSKLNLQ